MSLINPAYLFVFSVLTIPIIIHLLSQKNKHTRKVGSIQFHEATQARKMRTIQFSEPLLFLLRMLIFTLLCLLLIGVNWNTTTERNQTWVLIDPSIKNHPDVQQYIQDNPNQEFRFFQSDFPVYDSTTTDSTQFDFRTVLIQLNNQPVSDVVLFSEFRAEEVPKSLPELNYTIKYIPVKPNDIIIPRFFIPTGDSIRLFIELHTQNQIQPQSITRMAKQTQTINVFKSSIELEYNPTTDEYRINQNLIKPFKSSQIFIADDIGALKPYFENAIQSIEKLTHSRIQKTDDRSIASWIIKSKIDKSISTPQIYIHLKSNSVRFFSNTAYGIELNKSPIPSTTSPRLDTQFALELFQQLANQDRMQDYRQRLPTTQRNSTNNQAIKKTSSLFNILFIVLIILMGIERIVSYRKGHHRA